MFEGHGEGLVVVSPSSGPDVQVSQLKIGAKANETNKRAFLTSCSLRFKLTENRFLERMRLEPKNCFKKC